MTAGEQAIVRRALSNLTRFDSWRGDRSFASMVAATYVDLCRVGAAMTVLAVLVARVGWRRAGERFAATAEGPVDDRYRWLFRCEVVAGLVAAVGFVGWRLDRVEPGAEAVAFIQGVAVVALTVVAAVVSAGVVLTLAPSGTRWDAEWSRSGPLLLRYAVWCAPLVLVPPVGSLVLRGDPTALQVVGQSFGLMIFLLLWGPYWLRASILVGRNRFDTERSGTPASALVALLVGIMGLIVTLVHATVEKVDGGDELLSALTTAATAAALAALAAVDLRARLASDGG